MHLGEHEEPVRTLGLTDLAVGPMTFNEEADSDFRDFITDIGWSPLAPLPPHPDSSIFEQCIFDGDMRYGKDSFQGSSEKLAAMQDAGLRRSPASTNNRKRKYSSTGNLAHFPSKLSWDTDSSCDSDTHRLVLETPEITETKDALKRASSSSLACTLMPFSLVKESITLSDVNRRIRSVAEAEAAIAPQSQDSVNSLNSYFLLSNLQTSRSPYRPQIRVDRYSTAHFDASPPYSHSFASQQHFP